MYHPPASLSEDGWDVDEFEFIELMNVGSTAIDLTGVRFVEGVEFDFAGSAVTQLAPGAVRAGGGEPAGLRVPVRDGFGITDRRRV